MNIKSLVCCGFFAALISVTAWIAVPLAVPFTLQTFGVFCALLMLGGKLGTIAIMVYVLLGAIGLPVFAGFQGGTGVIFSPLGGFILGFVVMGLLYYLITKVCGSKTHTQLIALMVGTLSCHTTCTLWFTLFSDNIDFKSAVTSCVLPFIIPDAIKLWLAFIVSRRIEQANIFTDKKTT